MGHHSDEPFDGEPFEEKRKLEAEAALRRKQLMRDLMNTASFRGALGEFPQGKLTKADEGAIQFAVGISNGKVVLDFGTSVHWVGMSAQQAANLASSLLAKARECGRMNGEAITLTIGK